MGRKLAGNCTEHSPSSSVIAMHLHTEDFGCDARARDGQRSCAQLLEKEIVEELEGVVVLALNGCDYGYDYAKQSKHQILTATESLQKKVAPAIQIQTKRYVLDLPPTNYIK